MKHTDTSLWRRISFNSNLKLFKEGQHITHRIYLKHLIYFPVFWTINYFLVKTKFKYLSFKIPTFSYISIQSSSYKGGIYIALKWPQPSSPSKWYCLFVLLLIYAIQIVSCIAVNSDTKNIAWLPTVFDVDVSLIVA